MSVVDASRLQSILLTSGLQQKDPPLYQVINALISGVSNLQGSSSSGAGGGSSVIINNKTEIKQLNINEDGIDGFDGFPGLQGLAGINGIIGRDGSIGMPGLDGLDAEESLIPGPQGIPGLSGDLILLRSLIAASSATLDLVNWYSPLYDDYIIELINVTPATAAKDLQLLVSTDGGSTYNTTSNYYGAILNQPNTGALGETQTNAAAAGVVFASVDNTVASGGVSGRICMFNPASSAIRKTFTELIVASRAADVCLGSGIIVWNLTTAINAIRFKFASGNIASGIIRIYGISNVPTTPSTGSSGSGGNSSPVVFFPEIEPEESIFVPGLPFSGFVTVSFSSTGTVNNYNPGTSAPFVLVICSNASLATITGIVGQPGQTIVFLSTSAEVDFSHLAAGSSAGNKLFNFAISAPTPILLGSVTFKYNISSTQWNLISHEQGNWITPAFSAGNFTGSVSMTWTVSSGN